jgi:DNA-binding SARP family transcriptional activator
MIHDPAPLASSRDHPAVGLRLLGAFALTADADEVSLTPSAQRLLAYLALEPRWTPRAALAATLWPDSADQRAAGNLRSTLWRITRSVGQVTVTANTHRVRLDERVDVDIVRAERWARECVGIGGVALTAGDLLEDDLLPDWTEEWVAVRRESFRQVRLRALEALCARGRSEGRLREALDAGLAAVAADPLRESAHRQLVEVHLADGNLAEALRQYHFYRRILAARLGLAPSPTMRRLVAPLLTRSGRPVDNPSARLAGPEGRSYRVRADG